MTPYCMLVLMVHSTYSFTIQTNILCRDARPSRFDQTSRHNGAIDEPFLSKEIRMAHRGHNDIVYNIVNCWLSVVGCRHPIFIRKPMPTLPI